MSWTFAEERPIYWEEPPEQIAITNVETGKRDFYTLTSAVAERIRELRDENVRLRSCLSDTEEHASMFLWENNQLKEERDTLRELVLKLHSELVSCEENEYICGGHKFDEDVRELGVEV